MVRRRAEELAKNRARRSTGRISSIEDACEDSSPRKGPKASVFVNRLLKVQQ